MPQLYPLLSHHLCYIGVWYYYKAIVLFYVLLLCVLSSILYILFL